MTLTIRRGDKVKIPGIARAGRVVRLWYLEGVGVVAKIGYYRQRSGHLLGYRIEAAEKLTKVG